MKDLKTKTIDSSLTDSRETERFSFSLLLLFAYIVVVQVPAARLTSAQVRLPELAHGLIGPDRKQHLWAYLS